MERLHSLAECARLESACAERYRGFESHPLRQTQSGRPHRPDLTFWSLYVSMSLVVLDGELAVPCTRNPL